MGTVGHEKADASVPNIPMPNLGRLVEPLKKMASDRSLPHAKRELAKARLRDLDRLMTMQRMSTTMCNSTNDKRAKSAPAPPSGAEQSVGRPTG